MENDVNKNDEKSLSEIKLEMVTQILQADSIETLRGLECILFGHLWDRTKTPPVCIRCGQIY